MIRKRSPLRRHFRSLLAISALLCLTVYVRRAPKAGPPSDAPPWLAKETPKVQHLQPPPERRRSPAKNAEDYEESEDLEELVKGADYRVAGHNANEEVGEEDSELRDWHDRKRIAEDAQRTGPGEQGRAYRPKEDEAAKEARQKLYRVNGFNAMASDTISLTRALRDIRHRGCQTKKYLRRLPQVAVILPFHNEHLSTLLRSVHSIINRSPPELLKEVILVDDFSNKEFLKEELERYVASEWGDKVKIVRAERREGLIRARLLGMRAATAEVLLVLDSHSECGANWLPPLLEPIAKDYRTVVCPFVDVIDHETFEYRAQDEGARGAFDWDFFYKRLPLLEKDRLRPTEPFDNPVMAGGYFAISAKWFWELEGYDEGLDIWGGEQYELSFKVWQCGGRMVDAPCSRVGHIYRKFSPFPNPGVGDFIGRNYKRVAEVWMDEYAEYLYAHRKHYRKIDAGDLTKQRALRERLHCKPFKWFIEEVAFDLIKKYPPVEPPKGAVGEIRNKAADMCIDTKYRHANERFELEPCIRDAVGRSGEQTFVYSNTFDVRPGRRSLCFDVSSHSDHAPVVLFSCHGMGGNQEFRYQITSQHLFHPTSNLCLDCDAERREIFMAQCENDRDTQVWLWQNVNATLIRSWTNAPLDRR